MTLETFVQSHLPLWECRSNAVEIVLFSRADVLSPMLRCRKEAKRSGEEQRRPTIRSIHSIAAVSSAHAYHSSSLLGSPAKLGTHHLPHVLVFSGNHSTA